MSMQDNKLLVKYNRLISATIDDSISSFPSQKSILQEKYLKKNKIEKLQLKKDAKSVEEIKIKQA